MISRNFSILLGTTDETAPPPPPPTATGTSSSSEDPSKQKPGPTSEKEAVPLVDYIHNVMKFVDAILSNNATDDHCREFVTQKGLVPLMGILGNKKKYFLLLIEISL